MRNLNDIVTLVDSKVIQVNEYQKAINEMDGDQKSQPEYKSVSRLVSINDQSSSHTRVDGGRLLTQEDSRVYG